MRHLIEEINGLFSFQLFDVSLCNQVIEYAESSNDWSAASIGEESNGEYGSAVRPQYRSAVTFSPPPTCLAQRELTRQIERHLWPGLKRRWRIDSLGYADTHIVRYVQGGFYVTHADAGLDVDNRYFTVLCYLNDDYEGGRTSFPTLNHSVVPQKGKAIVFPATYLHRAEPVIAGTKYILVTWLVGHTSPLWI